MTEVKDGIISVKILDLADIADCPNKFLFKPPVEGLEIFSPVPSFSFLLEHARTGRRLLFDLGVPKDLRKLGEEFGENLNPGHGEFGWRVEVKDDIASFLVKNDISLESIEAVIWSHTHWDHKGDISTFPPSTDLMVGPSAVATFIEGNANSLYGGIRRDEIAGRKVREIVCNQKFGPFSAEDYFGDGSLLLLDSPGHDYAHICALAKTTNHPDTYVFLGGDAAYNCAQFRPSKQLPMPREIIPNPVTGLSTPPLCPGAWFQATNTKRGLPSDGPLYRPLRAVNMRQALKTIENIQELDGDNNILCIMAHDASIRHPSVPRFPLSINDWRQRDLRKYLNWSWIGDVWKELERNRSFNKIKSAHHI